MRTVLETALETAQDPPSTNHRMPGLVNQQLGRPTRGFVGLRCGQHFRFGVDTGIRLVYTLVCTSMRAAWPFVSFGPMIGNPMRVPGWLWTWRLLWKGGRVKPSHKGDGDGCHLKGVRATQTCVCDDLGRLPGGVFWASRLVSGHVDLPRSVEACVGALGQRSAGL
jgi:hypothetical protein